MFSLPRVCRRGGISLTAIWYYPQRFLSRPRLFCAGIFWLGLMAHALASDPSASTEVLLDRIIAAPHRAPADRQRDRYRHPKETLSFFRVRENMTVVEVWPGRGWYTEILAPFLRDSGKLYAAGFVRGSSDVADYPTATQEAFEQKLRQQPEIYDRVMITAFSPPRLSEIAPKGSVDRVLTFRNVHNWLSQGLAESSFRAFYEVLKPDGILGVVEHRAFDGTPLCRQIETGYVTERQVIELARNAGFALIGKSEVNANPKDTKDHPGGVWALPPTLRWGSVDEGKYRAIGESDRMTLAFAKQR